MISQTPSYCGYRFPPEIISHAVWLYHRFCLSSRDTEDLLAQRGITVSYETVRQWCLTFGPSYARSLRRRRGRMGDTWYVDEHLEVRVVRGSEVRYVHFSDDRVVGRVQHPEIFGTITPFAELDADPALHLCHDSLREPNIS